MANSYKDPYWSNLSAYTENLLKLPTGLLKNIMLHGEKSNADQVSSAGAKTVFQIIPSTRDQVLKKYGVDAYLNDKNAAMAAGLLLKESLTRNKGNIDAAVGEYHGGTDRSNWGPVNKAYRNRVMAAQNGSSPQPQNTYQKVKASFQQEQPPTIAKVYDAYRAGKLNAQQKSDFESDVKAGKIMLPEGAELIGKLKPQPITLPQSISDAYANGQLNKQQRSDLESDIKAGKVKLPVATKNKTSLPEFDQNNTIVQQPTEQGILPPQAPEPTLGQKIVGAGETALTLGTGAVTAPIASVFGTLGQAGSEIAGGNFGSPEAAQRIALAAQQAGQDYTYQPRTEAGLQDLQAVGDVLSPLESLPPVMGGLGVQTATLGRAAVPQAVTTAQRTAQAAAPVIDRAVQTVQQPLQAASNAVKSGVNTVRDSIGMGRAVDNANAPANMGAAQVDQATIRNALAQELPYPPQLTEGQLSRDPAQLKFEAETAKNPELGAPLRQRQEEQHQVMQQNIDAFIDMTGAKSTNMRETGIAVDKALQKELQATKNKVRVAYAKADKSEEAQYPVDLTQRVKNGDESLSVLDYLNSQPDLKSTPIIADAKSIALKLEIARRDENGNLIPDRPTVKQMEKWRSELNQNTNAEAPNIRQTAILKDMIDQHVEPVAGQLYKAARLERKKMAEHWENRKIITDLTENKVGSDDRKVALEDVQKRIIHDGSLDDLRVAKRALLTSGEEGRQAWKDIQGQTLQEIKNIATSGVAPDAQGNQMISPAKLNQAIKKLDDDGKLDFIFGQQGAEKLRALNDISKTLFTVPTSAGVNHSNTAATLMQGLMGMDIVLSGLSGFPAPVATALRMATKHIKDNKVRARVQKALNPETKGKSI